MSNQKRAISIASIIISIILAVMGIISFVTGNNNTSKASETTNNEISTQSVIDEKITGTGDKMIKGGEQYDFLADIGMTPSKTDWPSGTEYKIVVTNVVSENGSSYTYKTGDTSFVPSKNDDGKAYIIHYSLQKRVNNGSWQDTGIIATKKITVYAVNETKQSVGDDEAYIKSLSMSACSDGTGPWDADDTPGNDSNDSNGIVRSYDTVTYNVAYTTASYELGTSYKDAYINFSFVLPLEEKYGTFDTDAMSWMATNDSHAWKKENKTDENGKKYQVLTCSKQIISTDSTTAVPGSGEIYVSLRLYFAPNGTKIAPIVRAYMDGNKVGDELVSNHAQLKNNQAISNISSCNSHNNNELAECVLDEITVSAQPRYNLYVNRGEYMAELGGTFDFSTGNDTAPNKNAGNIRGRLIKYSVGMELRNEKIADGPDKGKSKYLRGIELPEGKITYNIDLSSSYLTDSNKSIDLSNQAQYTPLLWDVSSCGGSKIYGRSLTNISTQDINNPYDYRNLLVSRDGLQNPISKDSKGTYWGTGHVWNGGNRTATQLGSRINVTVDNYDINPLWFPNCSMWSRNSASTYFNPAQGVKSTNRGIFNVTCLYVVVPYGNDDDYLPQKYNESGTIRLKMSDNSLQATSESGQKLESANDVSNQTYDKDDSLTDSVWISRPGGYSNYIWYSPYWQPACWAGSGGTDDDYNKSRGSDTVMLGKDIGTYWGVIREANGEYKNAMQAADVLLKFDDKAFTIKKATPHSSARRILYATKKDGTGWTSDDEMNKTNIEELVYYKTLDEITSSNKICVGMLAEKRVDPASSQPIREDVFGSSVLSVTSDINMAGHVAQIVIESNAWNARSTDTDINSQAPSRLDVQDGKATEEEYSENRFEKNRKSNYIKTEYDANGTAIFHTGGTTIGDSALLTSYVSKISLSTAQENENGSAKSLYNLDNNQYSVDYVLSPSIDAGNLSVSGTTTATIKATLPAGLEYTPGSSNLGGTYKKSDRAGYKGTTEGGMLIDPNVSKDSSGKTTLTWIIDNVNLGTEELPKLYFNAVIDATTGRNVDFNVTASINTIEDQRVILVYNGNYSNYTIKTAKTADVSVQTKADKSINDSGADLKYTTSWSNNSSQPLDNQVMLVLPPQNNDAAGSKYNGGYTIKDIRLLNNAKDSAGNYQLWYTTDANGNSLDTTDEKLKPEEIMNGASAGISWKKITINADGIAEIPNGERITAWCVIGSIPGGGSVDASVTLGVTGNKSGDRYVNTVWLANSTTQASCYIVTRVLTGVTWIDSNRNNKREADEPFLAGVKVSLRDSDNNIVSSVDGIQCVTITDDNGEYRFNNLPSGTYHVVFEDGGANFLLYRQSVKHDASASDLTNCDAEGEYSGVLLTRGVTDDIIMPETDNIISTPYIVSNIDAGYSPRVDLPQSGGTGTELLWLLIALAPISAVAFIRGRSTGELGRSEKDN